MRFEDHIILWLLALAAASVLGVAWSFRSEAREWRRLTVGGISLMVFLATMYFLFLISFFTAILSGMNPG